MGHRRRASRAWSHRPLTAEQLRYAALDAEVLPALHALLSATKEPS